MEHPSFTVIIPAHNAAATLEACLDAVFNLSTIKPNQVIVVDDSSVDQTVEIAAKFPCETVSVSIAKGPMEARFAGVNQAEHSVLVFIDSDVVIQPNSFERILQHFQDPSRHAVTGLLSRTAPNENFFSAYKNEYMNYIFKKQPRDSHFLYGSIWAVRRESLILFDPISYPFGSLVSDSEMGFHLKGKGFSILLDPELEVTHLKSYSFLSLLKNDFMIPFLFSRMFMRYGFGAQKLLGQKKRGDRFSHASLSQVAAIGCNVLAWSFILFLKWIPALIFMTLFYFYWSPFLKQVKVRGLFFVFKAFLFLPLDALAMFMGMVAGFVFDCGLRIKQNDVELKKVLQNANS